MQRKDMDIRVFSVPGGEEASLYAYEELVKLLEVHEDLFLSVYRGMNRYGGKWILILIGEKTSLSRYQEQIQRPLSEVLVQPIVLPPESLTPLVELFLARQAEMLLKNETFMKKHHPLNKKHPSKKKRFKTP